MKVDVNKLYKSVLDMERSSVVLCNLKHEIVYMNKAAIANYSKWGGDVLIGKSLLNCHNPHSVEIIYKVIEWFKESPENNMIFTFHNEKQNKDVYMVALRDDEKNLIGYYEKHEYRNRENADAYDFTKSLV